ncbi:protein-disulfide reductase DsbD family protein [Cryomorphaceae bacterium 1068]|nr:protein-disulfide reductase DsbD family protein [Cryomorphaceae bacterium 1068]
MLKIKASIPLFFLAVFSLQAQVYDPVDWTFEVENTGETSADLVFSATIEEGWHVYATELPSDMGPIPTSVTLDESADFKALGPPKGGEYKTEFDPNFDMDLNYYDREAVFRLPIERISGADFVVTGYLTFMVCNDEMCLPPDDLDLSLKVQGASQAREGEVKGKPALEPISIQPITESEILEPVEWNFLIENETGSEATFVAEATIEKPWHLYSVNIEIDDDGPLPTELIFEDQNGYSLIGKPEENKPKTEYDPVFDMEIDFFEKKARFTQKIKKESADPIKLKGYVNYMVCDESKCIMEQADFEIDIKGKSDEATTSDDSIGEESSGEDRSYWGIFFWSFLSGFAALLTPCVFPMIPMTVSFFTKQSKTKAEGIRNSIIYGISIIVIYVVLGVVVTAIFGASVLSELSTDPWFNLVFFALLVIFAISFLGAFEITLPNSWISKADSKADKGGLIGIFFMAFVLALVSFSCTGPIVGTLIVEAASIGGTAPVIGMFGFSLAIALPFTLFAAFPGWMNSLPKSGGWLNSVKVVLGFLELALAFKFLSNADMVLQLHYLEREVFIAIWIVIFGLLTMYLLGKLKLPHDSDLKHISVSRLLLATLTGFFTIYMIPGLWGAPLKLIAAFPPPISYSESPLGVGYYGGGGSSGAHEEGTHLVVPGVYSYHDYNEGLAKAKELGKPLMLDFTGHACVNCRKMEQQVWSDPEISSMLANDVVLVSLYVDEKTPLPEAEQITVELTGGREKKLRNVGNKWAAFQELNYGVNAQPYYVILDHDEQKLIEPSNYQDYGTIAEFKDWLTRGIDKYKQ